MPTDPLKFLKPGVITPEELVRREMAAMGYHRYMTDRERRDAHFAVLRKHGFRAAGRTAKGSYRFRHKCGAKAYFNHSPTMGWRTHLRFRGLWGWTGRVYANAANLDRWMTAHK